MWPYGSFKFYGLNGSFYYGLSGSFILIWFCFGIEYCFLRDVFFLFFFFCVLFYFFVGCLLAFFRVHFINFLICLLAYNCVVVYMVVLLKAHNKYYMLSVMFLLHYLNMLKAYNYCDKCDG